MRFVFALLFLLLPLRAADRLFVDMQRDELLRAEPSLANVDFAAPEPAPGLLAAAGNRIAAMFDGLRPACAIEKIHALRVQEMAPAASRRKEFLYCAEWPAGAVQLREFRASPRTSAPLVDTDDEVLVAGAFVEPLTILLPANQARWRFRRLGRATGGGRDLEVFAFASAAPDAAAGTRQGLLWVDAQGVARYRIDEGAKRADAGFVAISGGSPARTVLLPTTVTVHSRQGMVEYHNVHRFSSYRMDGVSTLSATAPPAPEDGWELLESAAVATEPATSIRLLKDAARLEPGAGPVRFQLAAALWNAREYAQAEPEAVAAAELAPQSAAVQNLAGLALTKRDPKAALEHLRIAARLEPRNAVVQANLGAALEKSDDLAGALEAYRAALALDPDDKSLKQRSELIARALSQRPPAPDMNTIRVDVRQVLVPVVVTDRDGRHVPGLTRDDFRIEENGVEQKIAAFEERRMEPPPTTGRQEASAVPPREQSARPLRRTYVLCIDAVHSVHSSIVGIRKALADFFASQQGGETQYALMLVGRSMKILQNTTTDPKDVLQAVNDHKFEAALGAETRSSRDEEMRRYRMDLDSARAICDAKPPDPGCPAAKQRVLMFARQIASEEQQEIAEFLSQMRGIVDQLRNRTDRRALVLLSDGFELVPGRLAFELLIAYFPDMRQVSLATVDRQQILLDPVLRSATANDVAVHTIDTRGLYTQSYYDARNRGGSPAVASQVLAAMSRGDRDAGGTLSEIAAATGGTAFQNSNDMLQGLRGAFEDGREYYMLAYTPSNGALDGRFRRISVKLQNKRPATLRAKRGYWANP